MDSVLVESPIAAKPHSFGLVFNPPNYGPMLKESIDRFLSSAHSETRDFSAFRSIFSRLLQSSADPPLEVVWFYSAINYHESLSSSESPLDRVLAIKNLLQLLAACSSSSGGLKSIALLAPAISDVHRCVLESGKVSGKGAKKLRREIEGLIEGILSYISICSGRSRDGDDFGTGLLPCFTDLVSVWMLGRSGSGGGLDEFFPLVSEEVRQRFNEEGCGVGYLAGVVIVEAFLLRLCLKVQACGGSKEDLQKELRVWAVSSVTVFQNHIFFEILLRLLLDPMLPVISLLDSKGEKLVRDILYDVVILVDYSFLNFGITMDQSYDFMRCIAVRRLIVTHDAIRIARDKGDHAKAISYMGAFSTSCLPNQIIKWVADQTGIGRTKKPDVNSPQVVLDWLVGLEDHGLRCFEDSTSKLRTKLKYDKSKSAPEVSVSNVDGKEADANLFFIDNKGNAAEDEDMQPADDTAFLVAARSMKSPGINGRKRKDLGGEEETRGSCIKYKVHDSSARDCLVVSAADGASSGSEVDNPNSDDEMEEN